MKANHPAYLRLTYPDPSIQLCQLKGQCTVLPGKKSSSAGYPAERLVSLKTAIRRLKTGYRRELVNRIAECCDVGLTLVLNRTMWKRFCAEKAWEGQAPRADDQAKAVYHVLRWACGPTRNGQQNASFYFRAVSVLISGGTAPENIAEGIRKHGGLRKLAAEGKRAGPASKGIKRPAVKPSKVAKAEASLENMVPKRILAPTATTSAAFVRVEFNEHMRRWLQLKCGTSFSVTAILEEMNGASARITVQDLQAL